MTLDASELDDSNQAFQGKTALNAGSLAVLGVLLTFKPNWQVGPLRAPIRSVPEKKRDCLWAVEARYESEIAKDRVDEKMKKEKKWVEEDGVAQNKEMTRQE
uniref:Uncharacterized protein n=1 Tax=Melanopsichium pennsylvanicum 4 TaxID=1398559 RepID=A0A077R3H8_9BASI|nr:uncharacterized protein BN887_06110 [Melanopsichium pennsylvanicum 4]